MALVLARLCRSPHRNRVFPRCYHCKQKRDRANDTTTFIKSKVAKLARLDLPEAKIATYTGQLERILDYVAHLETVDTEGVPATTRAVEVVNVCREDLVTPTDVREELLNEAPQREGDFIRVPKIVAS